MFAFTRAGRRRAPRSSPARSAPRGPGGSDERPPDELDAAIIFASAGPLVPAALQALAPGGTVVCAGIHMSDIPSFPYEDLWHERSIRSVANLTRDDGHEFLDARPRGPGGHHDHHLPAGPRPSRRSPTCAPGAFEGTAVLLP